MGLLSELKMLYPIEKSLESGDHSICGLDLPPFAEMRLVKKNIIACLR